MGFTWITKRVLMFSLKRVQACSVTSVPGGCYSSNASHLQIVALGDIVRVLLARRAFGHVRGEAIERALGAIASTALLMLRSTALSGTMSLVIATVSRCVSTHLIGNSALSVQIAACSIRFRNRLHQPVDCAHDSIRLF